MRVRSIESVENHVCPFCGKRVLGDRQASTFHHEDPTCDAFAKKMQEFGLRPVRVEPTIWTEPKGPIR